jgi:uncharacterized membrane protein
VSEREGTAGAPDLGAGSREDAAPPEEADAALAGRADPRTNRLLTGVLRAGLGLSFVVLAVGLAVELSAGPHRAVTVRMFDLLAPRPVGERIMAVGVLLLTLTPACGVLSVFAGLLREHDRRYVAVAATVVAVLGAAVIVGVT